MFSVLFLFVRERKECALAVRQTIATQTHATWFQHCSDCFVFPVIKARMYGAEIDLTWANRWLVRSRSANPRASFHVPLRYLWSQIIRDDRYRYRSNFWSTGFQPYTALLNKVHGKLLECYSDCTNFLLLSIKLNLLLSINTTKTFKVPLNTEAVHLVMILANLIFKQKMSSKIRFARMAFVSSGRMICGLLYRMVYSQLAWLYWGWGRKSCRPCVLITLI